MPAVISGEPSKKTVLSKTETPQPLSESEKFLAGLLMLAGAVLTVVVLEILLSDGKWLIEESSTTGDGATKVVESRKYSDTVPLAAVGIGGLLFLCGAFFGRLREITLPGGAGIKLDDAKQHMDEKVEQAAEKAVEGKQLSEPQMAVFKETAHKEANARLFSEIVLGPRPMAEWEFDRIANEAIDSAERVL
ncbi:MAG TPA: hypothetical protein VHF88_10560 [Thermoleophilaceae bacterium]|nr:hypothetical protein [Thermoleophilaceae bacterium]